MVETMVVTLASARDVKRAARWAEPMVAQNWGFGSAATTVHQLVDWTVVWKAPQRALRWGKN